MDYTGSGLAIVLSSGQEFWAEIVFFTGVLGFWMLGFCFWAGGIEGIVGGVGG